MQYWLCSLIIMHHDCLAVLAVNSDYYAHLEGLAVLAVISDYYEVCA